MVIHESVGNAARDSAVNEGAAASGFGYDVENPNHIQGGWIIRTIFLTSYAPHAVKGLMTGSDRVAVVKVLLKEAKI